MVLRPILDGGAFKRSARSYRAAQTRRERREDFASAAVGVVVEPPACIADSGERCPCIDCRNEEDAAERDDERYPQGERAEAAR